MHLEVILLLVFSITSLAEAVKYELSVLDEDIFSSCHDPDPSTLDINGLMDFSDLTTSMDADGITVKGNTTLVWDIQQKDRVQMNLNLSYLDRGTWTSTVFSLSSRDFCKVMYDKNQLWYKYWTEHVSNDIVDKCLNVSGTKMVYKTFVLSLTANVVGGALREGRYKTRIIFRAYDSSGTERPTRICFEVQGELFKL
ncbi:uncharacterized protein [Drosophila suzukii]|uniref:Uncharacterized protein n=1 Tax=Drosophila suzukii TaxID=28584 RepID=A0AB39Z1H4_DROSZ